MKKLWCCLLLIGYSSAYASLGELSNSVDIEVKNLSAQILTSQINDKYLIKSINDKNGQIKEYINTSTNKVFAVIWATKRIPNMKVLLGNYYEDFSKAKQSSYGLTSGANSSNNLVSNYGGVQGHFFGRVVLTPEMPEGISLGDLQ